MITATANFLAANTTLNKRPIFRLEIAGYPRAFVTTSDGSGSPWISAISDQTNSIDVLSGTCTIGDLTVTVLDYERQLTADLPGFILEGLGAVLKCGFVGLAPSDYLTLFTCVVDSVPSSDNNTTYQFICKDRNRLNQVVIYLNGDDGQATSTGHAKTLLGNPLDLLVSLLEYEVGWPTPYIDIARIQLYRDELFGGIDFQFSLTSAPDAKGLIENEILKPLGGWAYYDNLGKFSVDFLQPLAGLTTPVYSFTPSNLTAVPAWLQSGLINTVTFRFDHDGSNFQAEVVEQYAKSIDLYNQQGQNVIESNGMRSGFGGFALAAVIARSIFNRYGLKNPTLDLTAFWDTCVLQLGDFIQVTHPLVPNRKTGLVGIANMPLQIVSRTYHFDSCTVDFGTIDASQVKTFGLHHLAPDSIPPWSAASLAQRAQYLFIGGADGKQSDGTPNGDLS